jgi:homocysteine S-methyltransferase
MPARTANPLLPFVDRQGALILDGGLATTLADRGHDLDDPLWSARVLIDRPAAIGSVHADFLAAGADVITTATYQASAAGFAARGLDAAAAASLMNQAVDLAVDARDRFWSDTGQTSGRLRPLVAASVGPYGAYLADGSEYSGRYEIDARQLRTFHRDRWQLLAASRADLLACETLPSLVETEVLLELLDETPQRWAWFSFSCRDGATLWDGTPLATAVARCSGRPGVAAVGINCTDPRHVGSLIAFARRATDLTVIVYPNSGERYEPSTKTWQPGPPGADITAAARRWRRLGAAGIGGCCRIGPGDIARIRAALLD